MKAKYKNGKKYEEVDTDMLENDSDEEWSEELLRWYILDICPKAKNIIII